MHVWIKSWNSTLFWAVLSVHSVGLNFYRKLMYFDIIFYINACFIQKPILVLSINITRSGFVIPRTKWMNENLTALILCTKIFKICQYQRWWGFNFLYTWRRCGSVEITNKQVSYCDNSAVHVDIRYKILSISISI
jgi:hypothetical protein